MLTRRLALGMALLVSALAAPPAAGAAATATFTKSSDWGSGFVGNYGIRNGGTSSIVGWKLEFDLPPGERLTSAWSAKMSAVGNHYVLTDEDWTRTILPGGSVQVGFQGEYLGTFGAPANCMISGQPCGGGPAPPPPDTTAPTAPSGLTASNATPSSIDLRWSASSDNVGVTGYQVFSGATKVATVTGTSTTVTGLSASTPYTFTVKAVDAAGNVSTASNGVTATTAAPPPPPPSGGVTATFAKTSDWGNGFVGNYVIRNGGSATVTDWKLEFDLPSTEHVTSAWSGKLSASGNHYVLTPEDWTRTIAPGSSVQVGFQGDYAGAFAAPGSCTVNGASCSGGPPDTTAPSAPSGLAVSNPTASTVDLRWSASSDNVGVTGYQVFSGATKVATVNGTSMTVTGLAASTSYTFTVKAVDAAGNVSAASTGVSATTAAAGGGGGGAGPATAVFAPYVDMTLDNESLAAMKSASGVKHFSLGFIVSGGTCMASWGGFYGLDDATIAKRISDLAAAGGDAIVSFGGAAGQELARTCTSVSSLTAQYQAAIDRYGIRTLDFDIEGADQAEPVSLDRRFKAIAQLQAAGRQAGKAVHVSLTLPVMPTGLTQDGRNVVRTAITDGVDVDVVNVMAMDYFDPSLSPYRMGDLAVQAATSTHDQLAALYPSLSDGQLWAKVGITPMLGINDDNNEVFTTADAAQLTTFAKQKGLGRLAMWSINRDHPCGRPTSYAENLCSGVSDPDWAFSRAFGSFGS